MPRFRTPRHLRQVARPRRSRLAAGLVAGGLVALAASAVLLSGRDPAPREPSAATGGDARGSTAGWGHQPPPLVCLDVHADVIVAGIDLGLVVGGHHHDCHPPPTTTTTSTTTTTTVPPSPPTTTTTTTTTVPPPPPTTTTTTTAPPPTVAVVPPPPPTSTTTSTSTTTLPPPPPPLPEPPPPRIAVSAAFDPHRPAEGQLATVTLEVRNDGEGPADDLVLTDEVSPTTQLRSATSPDGDCTVAGRTVTCRLGRLGPGEPATVLVRVKVVDDPASSTLVQRVALSTGGQVEVAERSFSALVDPGPPRGPALLDLPGPTVTLVALVTFVLAARSGPGVTVSGSR